MTAFHVSFVHSHPLPHQIRKSKPNSQCNFKVFMEVIKVNRTDVLIRRGRDTRELSLSPHTHREEAIWGHNKKAGLYKPG